MADPDYDLDPAETQKVITQLGRAAALPPGQRALRSTLQLGRAGRLPGTAAEAEHIVPRLKKYTGKEPLLYTDKQALKSVFRATRNPQLVVLSTHGFFQESMLARAKEGADGKARQTAAQADDAIDNPLRCCGLLLAGCNQRDRAGSGDDGILTGEDIVATDLRGTELVVLSACETGLGQINEGEGIAGLRQAFQLAGAQSVLATLWQIPDRETVQLMSRFFDGLAQGKDRAEALRQAQLSLIQARRKRYDAAHPFFWAAFTLTGQ
jgi:CHAT domain-containing protein